MNRADLNVLSANMHLYTKEFDRLQTFYDKFNLPFRTKETSIYYMPVDFVARQKQHTANAKFSVMTILYAPLNIYGVDIIGFHENTGGDSYQNIYINSEYEQAIKEHEETLFRTKRLYCSHCSKRYSKVFMFITYNKNTKQFGVLSTKCFEEITKEPYNQYRTLIAYTNALLSRHYDAFQGLKTGKIVHHIHYKEFLDKLTLELEKGNVISEKLLKSIDYKTMVSPNSYFNEFQEFLQTDEHVDERVSKLLANYDSSMAFPYKYATLIGEEFGRFYNIVVLEQDQEEKREFELDKTYDFENVRLEDKRFLPNKRFYVYDFREGNQKISYISKRDLTVTINVGDILSFKAKVYRFNAYKGVESINISNLKSIVIHDNE